MGLRADLPSFGGFPPPTNLLAEILELPQQCKIQTRFQPSTEIAPKPAVDARPIETLFSAADGWVRSAPNVSYNCDL